MRSPSLYACAGAVNDLATRQPDALKRKVLEEAVFSARWVEDSGIGWRRQTQVPARVAARSDVDSRIADARFVASSGRDEF